MGTFSISVSCASDLYPNNFCLIYGSTNCAELCNGYIGSECYSSTTNTSTEPPPPEYVAWSYNSPFLNDYADYPSSTSAPDLRILRGETAVTDGYLGYPLDNSDWSYTGRAIGILGLNENQTGIKSLGEFFFTGKIYRPSVYGSNSITWSWYSSGGTYTEYTISDSTVIQITNSSTVPSITKISGAVVVGKKILWIPPGATITNPYDWFNYDSIVVI
jgi:hypothetical protein